jgi:hypothetical protein
MTFKKLASGALPVLQAVFYLAFVFLWFKDNFRALKPISLSPLWAVIPLAAITFLRLLLWAKLRKLSLPPGWKRDAAALGIIVVLSTIVHVPFLAHSFGLMDSDEAITALMGKHIAEGQQPPLYFYGAFFQGSFPQHWMAVFFKLFGYSIFLAKLSAYLAFVLFLGIQFFLLKKAFSFGFACVAGLFYVLPWQELVSASLDIASGFPVVLLLGSLALTLTAGLVFDDKSERLAALGFVLGLSFWSHQISIIYCAAVAPFLAFKFRFRIKKYLELAVYFLIGCFPLLLNEFARGFPIVRVFFLGQSGSFDSHRLRHARKFLAALISSGPPAASLIYLGVMAAGFFTVVLLAVRRKTPRVSLLFPVYFLAFMAIYLLSEASGTYVLRYLYILYIVMPVLLGAPFLWLKPKARYSAAAAVIALVFALSQAGASRAYYEDVRGSHDMRSRTVTAMAETGEKFWIGDFWTSYLLTSLSGEKLIVASKDVRRYYSYELRYWSEGGNNWVIDQRRAETELYASVIADTANRVGVTYERQDVGRYALIYRLSQDVFPRIILASPPKNLPDVRLSRTETGGGELGLEFVRDDSWPTPGVGFRVEIPGYCVRYYPMWERGRFTMRMPFPLKEEIKIRFGFTYAGFRLEGSTREAVLTLAPAELAQPRPALEFLEGIGPQRDVGGRPMFVCRKAAVIEVNRPVSTGASLALDLYSPFDFKDPWWYGDFSQSVAISVNGRTFGERTLGDGKTTILIETEPPFFTGRGDIVRLEFKYAMPMSYAENYKTAAYLERIAFE